MDETNARKFVSWKPTIEIERIEIKTEIPIKQEMYNNFNIIGFIDILYIYHLIVRYENHNFTNRSTCSHCFAEKEEKKPCFGRHTHKFAIEVKPRIDSFGNLVRQINKYKEYTRGEGYEWIIFTKTNDETIKKAVESQEIRVKIAS